MIVTNIESVPGKTIVEYYGVVQGSSVRAKNVGRDFLSGIKNIFGGELTAYTELLQETRTQAVQRMIKQAQSQGANAIINIRFATSTIAAGASEIFGYGTAVMVQ